MAKLKPCPFCGGENLTVVAGDADFDTSVYCMLCGAFGPGIRRQRFGHKKLARA